VQLFRRSCPRTPLIYYSRDTGPEHWAALHGIDFQCLGVDWRHDLAQTLQSLTGRWAVQGNIDPQWLLLSPGELERRLREVWGHVQRLPDATRAAWVCGLGHGVLQHTPEENVHLALRIQREMFA
jgi:uroporphyrinogen decarboxylase